MSIEVELKKIVSIGVNNLLKKLLVAVSTGVDSMVLLDILLDFAKERSLQIGVVHVNHQLREESNEEEAFLRDYCQERTISFYSTKWQPTPTGIEANARAFRYDFFQQVMDKEGYEVLVTAHHSDDQIETMLMKLLRDGQLSTVKGIVQQREMANGGQLVRPLLKASKEMIYEYAAEKQVPFFEDKTNKTADYLRNRLRDQVVPLLKHENGRTAQHFQQVSEQIVATENLLDEIVWSQDKEHIQKNDNCFRVSMAFVVSLSKNHRSYFFNKCAIEAKKQFDISISNRQQTSIGELVEKETPQWLIQLEKNWVVRRSYEMIVLEKQDQDEKGIAAIEESYQLLPGTSTFLTEKQWIGFFEEQSKDVPAEVENWEEDCLFLDEQIVGPLTVRKRLPGDRLQLSKNLTKRVSRWLIDQKIPNEVRDSGWFVSDFHKKGVVFFPFVHSCLSITSETDKIRYVLLYKYRK